MSLTTCQIHFTKQPGKAIYATSALLKQLQLKPNDSVQLGLGKTQTEASLKQLNRRGRHLYIPASLSGQLRIPQGRNLYITSSGADDLKLGPLMGILTVAYGRTATRPFGSRTASMRSYLRGGSNKALYFAFAPQDVNWEEETVTGHFLNDRGGWTRRVVPLPDVVYNRVTDRRAEHSPALHSLKDRFVKKNIPIFNWNFYDKWQIYDALQKEMESSGHVPETHIAPTAEKIKTMLDNHQVVYLKPTSGSLGFGIYRLTHMPGSGYYIRYRQGERNVLLRYASFSKMMRAIKRMRGNSLRNYVIQQGIRLIELDQCPIDFRFHLNKNGHNEWVVAGIGAKKAGRGSVTTHVRTGGQLLTPEYALNRCFEESTAEQILKQAKQAAIRIAETMERTHPHLIGEIGFDIGIDKKGAIWMFEANSKPGRSIFKHPALKSQGKNSLRYLFEHCMYLSKFKKGRRLEQP